MSRFRAARHRGEHGTALVEVTWLALLLLVPLVYLLVSVFDVQRASYGVTAATRAAARAYVLAPDERTARARAERAAAVALADQGIDLDPAALSITCRQAALGCLRPGAVVRVDLRLQVRLPLMPSALGRSAPSIAVSSTQLTPYGTFREAR